VRKMFSFMAVSADGYHADPGQALDWQTLDEEFRQYSLEQLGEADTLVLGRVTYELLAAYWPAPAGEEFDPGIAKVMNAIGKIVVCGRWRRPRGRVPGSSMIMPSRSSASSSSGPARTSRSSAAPP
jgi:dihydrofolate reductase